MLDMPKTEKKKENLVARQPIVVVVGHIDHGKTAILDFIRKTNVVEKEAGGITQHIGAYEVEKDGKNITFIDTPGHEAFFAMRQRGAKVADIAILVVDATEGVKTQTKEAIKFIKKTGIPMIVALNKIDKPSSQPEKVKKELGDEDVVVESFGGKVPSVNVSAKTGKGIDELLETILLVAEIEDIKASLQGPAKGTVIESSLDAKKGPLATLILEKGVLKKGDVLATPSALGKAKYLTDFQGKSIVEGLPAQPVSILGFETPPGVSEKFKVYSTREEARIALAREKGKYKTSPVIDVEKGAKVLNVILKADVLGSAEAIEGILKNLPREKVVLRVLKSDVGDVTTSDIQLAETGRAKILGFRVAIDGKAKMFAQQKGVKVKIFEVIYELVQEIRREMTNILEPEVKRVDLGKFKVTHLFKQGKGEQIIGGKVIDGEILLNTKVEIIREEELLGKGRIKTLQKEKQNIGKATKGQQVGMLFRAETELEEGDILQIFREEKEKGTL